MKKREVEKHRPEDKRKLVAFDEEKHIYSAGQSTVEVIVKLRRKKGQDKELNHLKPSSSAVTSQAERPFRTGSWGDLFNQQQRHNQSKKLQEPQIVKTEREFREREIQTINTELKKENDSLKIQASILSEDLSKAKAELKECFTTIKDLRELSDLLKYENECLTGSRKQRQEIEEIHKKTVTENQLLRAQLSKLTKQYTEITAPKDQQISKFRNAIKEMKSTIEDEIDEMRHKNDNLMEISPSLFQHIRVAESEDMLNNSNPLNASEFQKILNSVSCSSLSLPEAGDASSTQYMTVPKPSSSQASSSNSEMAEWLRQKHEFIKTSSQAQ